MSLLRRKSDHPLDPETQRLQDELYAAYDTASANAADPLSQKAFRQKFAEARAYVHKEHDAK